MSTTHFPLTLGLHDPVHGAPDQDRRFRYAPLSIGLHVAMVAALILAPLFGELRSPEPAVGVRAFFVEPSNLAPPPPPPPPPAAARAAARPPTTPLPSASAFVAPIEVPDEIARPVLNVGAEGGVAGGVEGGVEGGVAGGIVGGLPAEIPPPPTVKAVRVGGEIRAPARLVYVAPEYPHIASQAGVQGMVILEARVGTDGRVREATVLRGQPLFDEPAKAAVMQWRYQPLLLNGIAMEFVLTVTVQFALRPPE